MRCQMTWRLAAVLMAFLLAGFPLAARAEDEDFDDDPEEPFNPLHGDVRLPDKGAYFHSDVQTSIENGRRFLASSQKEDGSWKCRWDRQPSFGQYENSWGETALALLALLESSEERESDSIEKGFSFLRKQPLMKTYAVGILMMAIEARWAEKPEIDAIPDFWERMRRGKPRTVLPRIEESWMEECARFLLENRVKSGKSRAAIEGRKESLPDEWSYPGDLGPFPDHSNTHVALLGLNAAMRCGIKVPEEVWASALEHFLDTQESDGPAERGVKLVKGRIRRVPFEYLRRAKGEYLKARGWCYRTNQRAETCMLDKGLASTGSMTAAGITSLQLAKSALRAKLEPAYEKRIGGAVGDGFAWLGRYWDVKYNPNHSQYLWRFYYYWALEQAASLSSRRVVGLHDWYREIAEHLMDTQRDDGSWDDGNCPGSVTNTAFALLFLARSMRGK